MTRKIEGRGAFIDGDGGRGTSLEAAPQREVEVTVYDKVLDEMRVFRCDLHLLETSMAYFSPIIRRYLGEEEEKERAKKASVDGAEVGDDAVAAGISSVASGKGGSGTVKSQEEGGSSKCKRPVVRSPIPLRVNCDMGIFAWLMSYVEGKQRPFTPENAVSIALSSNFLLMTQLVDLPLQYIKDHLVQVMLSGVNMECLTGELLARLSSMLSEGDLARAFLKLFEWRVEDSPNRRFLTALLRHMVCDRFGQGRAIGLRWCRYCGVLFDEQELKRLQRSGKSVRPVICPRLTKNSIGTRGEILTTHVSSQHPVDLAFPSLSWSDEHVERWAWRIIGATCFFLCRRCNHHVMLIDTVDHGCHGGMTNFVFVDGCSRSDAEALLAWYEVAKDLYVGGLSSMHSHQTDVPRECILALSPTGEWICDDGSERGVPGLWCTHPIAVARSVDAKGKVSLDSQNGFERWLVMELQQVMEEFGDLGRPGALEGNTRTPTPPPHSMSPVGGVGTSALPLHFGARNRGESLNGSGSTRPPFRGGRSDGRAGIANGNDTAGRRKEAPSSGMQQRARAVAGCARGAAYEHNRNGIASPSTQSVRVQEAHAPKLSMQNLLSLSSVLGKRNPTLQQATQMKPLSRGLSSGETQWIWHLDPATLHAIDFLAYRLGLFHAPPTSTGSNGTACCGGGGGGGNSGKTAPSTKQMRADRLNRMAKNSSLVVSSSHPASSLCNGRQVLHEEIRPYSSLAIMQQMMREWQKRQRALVLREAEQALKDEVEFSTTMRHPESLFADEDAVMFRFGMGAFVSPAAPGFSGLFRQHWKDFMVTEMVTDASGSGIALSRVLDWSVPPLPASLLHAGSEKEQGIDVEGGPHPSFFSVNVEERVAELVQGDSKSGEMSHTEVSEGEVSGIGGRFYLQAYLHKQHIAHSVALSNIAQTLRMHPTGISVAGIKDYIGDTIQRVRLKNITPAAALEANRVFRRKKWAMRLSDFSYETEPLYPGRLFGNQFKIVLRDVTAPREDVERAINDFSVHGFPNYYGCQRFSWFGGKNDAAFALLHHNWLAFAFRFLGYTSRERTLRELLQREKKYPNPVQDEYRRNVVRRLRSIAMDPGELDVAPFLSCPALGVPPTSVDGGPISKKQELIILQLRGAFLDLSMTSRRLTAQRLSSYLWNQVLTLRLHHFGSKVLVGDMLIPETFRQVETSPEDRKDWYREGIRFIADDAEKDMHSITDVVHVGFSFNGIQRPRNATGEYYLQVCEKYRLDWYAQHTRVGIRDFLEPPRPIIRKPLNLSYDYNKAESKLTLEFALERGCYANVAITELMKQLRCAGSDDILTLPAPDAMWDLGDRDPGYVTTLQDIYSGFQDGLGFVTDEHEVPLVGEGKVWDCHNGPLFLPESADPVRKAYRWGERHLLRNMARRARDEEMMKRRLFEKPLAGTLKDGEVSQYAGHTVPMSPNTRAKKIFFKVLRRQRRFPGAPKAAPRLKRGAQIQKRTAVQAPFKTIDRNTWNVTW